MLSNDKENRSGYGPRPTRGVCGVPPLSVFISVSLCAVLQALVLPVASAEVATAGPHHPRHEPSNRAYDDVLCTSDENHGRTFYRDGHIMQCSFPRGAIRVCPCDSASVRDVGTRRGHSAWCLGRDKPVPDSAVEAALYTRVSHACGAAWMQDVIVGTSFSGGRIVTSPVSDCAARGLQCVDPTGRSPYCGSTSASASDAEIEEEKLRLRSEASRVGTRVGGGRSLRSLGRDVIPGEEGEGEYEDEDENEGKEGGGGEGVETDSVPDCDVPNWYGVECSASGDVVRCTGTPGKWFVLDPCSARGAACRDEWEGVAYCSDRLPRAKAPFQCSNVDRGVWNVSYCEESVPHRGGRKKSNRRKPPAAAVVCTPGGEWSRVTDAGKMCFVGGDRRAQFVDSRARPDSPPARSTRCGDGPRGGTVMRCSVGASGRCDWSELAHCSVASLVCREGECVARGSRLSLFRAGTEDELGSETSASASVSTVSDSGATVDSDDDDGQDHEAFAHLPQCDESLLHEGEVHGCYAGGLAQCVPREDMSWRPASPASRAEVLGVEISWDHPAQVYVPHLDPQQQQQQQQQGTAGGWAYLSIEGLSIAASQISRDTTRLVPDRTLEFITISTSVGGDARANLVCFGFGSGPGPSHGSGSQPTVCASARPIESLGYSAIAMTPEWRWWGSSTMRDRSTGALVIGSGVHLRFSAAAEFVPVDVVVRVGFSSCDGSESYITSASFTVDTQEDRRQVELREFRVLYFRLGLASSVVASIAATVCIAKRGMFQDRKGAGEFGACRA